ncbi:MAG: DUF4058 family protein [Pirellula sp.]
MRRFPKNPLPGMNPWLEEYWGDIHSRLTLYAADSIGGQLPPTLHAHVEEYLAIEHDPERGLPETRSIAPDVTIRESISGQSGPGSSSVAVLDDLETDMEICRRWVEPPTLRRIKIVDTSDGSRVITVIEFLSPSNKTKKGAESYIQKQRELLDADVSLVEIDLIRRGHWIMAADEQCYPRRVSKPYRICVSRSTSSIKSEVYLATFARPLPKVKIPLRESDADVLLPLQPLVDQAYENGRYGNIIDYDKLPTFALEAEESSWIQDWLAKVL